MKRNSLYNDKEDFEIILYSIEFILICILNIKLVLVIHDSKLKIKEALENVLIPYRLDENIQLLKNSGFSSVDVFFKWFNWCGIVAIKE